jgi:uncharacterized membrane protein YphA (DoxX/SURF4 family)
MNSNNKIMTWTGRVISGMVAIMMTLGAIMVFRNSPDVSEQFVNKFGYPADLLLAIGIVEMCCVVLYVIPQTAVLGAVLLTGYLGGAVATHVRVHDNFAAAVIAGVLVWLGLFLRDPRIRALLPIRRALPTSTEPPKP